MQANLNAIPFALRQKIEELINLDLPPTLHERVEDIMFAAIEITAKEGRRLVAKSLAERNAIQAEINIKLGVLEKKLTAAEVARKTLSTNYREQKAENKLLVEQNNKYVELNQLYVNANKTLNDKFKEYQDKFQVVIDKCKMAEDALKRLQEEQEKKDKEIRDQQIHQIRIQLIAKRENNYEMSERNAKAGVATIFLVVPLFIFLDRAENFTKEAQFANLQLDFFEKNIATIKDPKQAEALAFDQANCIFSGGTVTSSYGNVPGKINWPANGNRFKR